MDKAELKEAINEALDARDRIDRQTHHDDHQWVQLQRQREKRWNDAVEKVRLTVIGAVALGALGLAVKFLSFIGALVVAGMSIKTNGGS